MLIAERTQIQVMKTPGHCTSYTSIYINKLSKTYTNYLIFPRHPKSYKLSAQNLQGVRHRPTILGPTEPKLQRFTFHLEWDLSAGKLLLGVPKIGSPFHRKPSPSIWAPIVLTVNYVRKQYMCKIGEIGDLSTQSRIVY